MCPAGPWWPLAHLFKGSSGCDWLSEMSTPSRQPSQQLSPEKTHRLGFRRGRDRRRMEHHSRYLTQPTAALGPEGCPSSSRHGGVAPTLGPMPRVREHRGSHCKSAGSPAPSPPAAVLLEKSPAHISSFLHIWTRFFKIGLWGNPVTRQPNGNPLNKWGRTFTESVVCVSLKSFTMKQQQRSPS